jgi:Yip1 domain
MNFPTSQTPPPPLPGQQPMPPTAAEPAGPGLSEPQRLVNVFIAPSKTFTDLKRKASWWVPWLITSIFTLIFAVVAVQKIDMAHFVQQQIDKSPRQQKQLEQLTPEQRAQNLAIRATISKFSFYAYPVFSLIGGLIIAAILMAVFNFVLGAEITFPRALSVVFYAGLTGILRAILLAVSLLTASDPSTIDITANPMPTNPGFFLDPQGNQVLYSLASAIDIFTIWYVILLGLGFSLVSANKKPATGTAITTMFVLYGIVVLGGLGLKLAFS